MEEHLNILVHPENASLAHLIEFLNILEMSGLAFKCDALASFRAR